MNPALSVIVFTTASGAGYGLLALTGILVWNGMMPMDRTLGIIVLGLGVGLVTGGLLASTYHLGHPERAWRAFSQWRSSWLSREGVVAVMTYIPACILTWVWLVDGKASPVGAWSGLALSVLALLTIFCTAMIYRSLATIPQWHNPLTVPCYLTFGIMTGALLLNAALFTFGDGVSMISVLAVVFCLSGLLTKVTYWHHIDQNSGTSTMESATGIQGLGRVQAFESPHSADNYLLKEMGFSVARKHAVKLRRLALVLGFGVPLVLSAVAIVAASEIGIAAAIVAVLAAAGGVFVERWLFFAEARHSVTLYYGSKNA